LAVPGSVVAANQPVVQLEDDSSAEVIAQIPSSVAAGLRRGRRAEILVAGGTGHFQAAVQSVAAAGTRNTEIVLRIIERARPPRDAVLRCRLLPG
jgi:multidrug resistance efflux pump